MTKALDASFFGFFPAMVFPALVNTKVWAMFAVVSAAFDSLWTLKRRENSDNVGSFCEEDPMKDPKSLGCCCMLLYSLTGLTYLNLFKTF